MTLDPGAALEAVAERARAVVAEARAAARLEWEHRDKETRAMLAVGYPEGEGWRYFLSDEVVALERALAALEMEHG